MHRKRSQIGRYSLLRYTEQLQKPQEYGICYHGTWITRQQGKLIRPTRSHREWVGAIHGKES